MRQYGILLDDFESNGEYVNDCVFTMMHHIGGDMNQVASLFQPSILKTFTQIWERDFQICDVSTAKKKGNWGSGFIVYHGINSF